MRQSGPTNKPWLVVLQTCLFWLLEVKDFDRLILLFSDLQPKLRVRFTQLFDLLNGVAVVKKLDNVVFLVSLYVVDLVVSCKEAVDFAWAGKGVSLGHSYHEFIS